jgi:hypothetical protein
MTQAMTTQKFIHHCIWDGCRKSVEHLQVFMLPPVGWSWLGDWGPGVPAGMYCQEHADALWRPC